MATRAEGVAPRDPTTGPTNGAGQTGTTSLPGTLVIPRLQVQALEGRIAVDDHVTIEVHILVHRALNAVVGTIAQKVKEARKDAPSTGGSTSNLVLFIDHSELGELTEGMSIAGELAGLLAKFQKSAASGGLDGSAEAGDGGLGGQRIRSVHHPGPVGYPGAGASGHTWPGALSSLLTVSLGPRLLPREFVPLHVAAARGTSPFRNRRRCQYAAHPTYRGAVHAARASRTRPPRTRPADS